MPSGALFALGSVYSVIAPEVVIRPTLLPPASVNQRFPSGPPVTRVGTLPAVGTMNSVKAPAVVSRPILPVCSVNHRFPSAPVVIPDGRLFGVGTEYSVKVPATVRRPI